MNTNSRQFIGSSLVELLTVIAIFSLLSILGLGAVQKVRSASEDVSRQNWRIQHRLGVNIPRKQPIRMLLIGNSFSFFRELPQAIVGLAKSAGHHPAVEIETSAFSSHSLEKLWLRPEPRNAIKDQSKKWDIVALQEMRGLPVAREGPDGYGFIFGRESRFVPYARKFHEEIQKQKAITMLFMTWKTPALNGLTQAEWTDSHLKLAKQLQTEVSPVGMAIEKVQLLNPQIALFDDLYPGHLNTNGVYICACAFYAALFHESPIGLPRVIIHPSNNNTTVTAANALIFQTAAWSAHQETQKRLRN